jgi:hypothetical protein
MTYIYKVTVIGVAVNNWQDLRNLVFASAQPVEETYGGQEGVYTFSTQQTPTDLGPLVRVELLTNDNP